VIVIVALRDLLVMGMLMLVGLGLGPVLVLDVLVLDVLVVMLGVLMLVCRVAVTVLVAVRLLGHRGPFLPRESRVRHAERPNICPRSI